MAFNIKEYENYVKEMRKTDPNFAKGVEGEKFRYTKKQVEALTVVSKKETKQKKETK